MRGNDDHMSKVPALVELAKYTVHCANKFFRILRAHGAWLEGPAKLAAVQCGMDMNEPYLHIVLNLSC